MILVPMLVLALLGAEEPGPALSCFQGFPARDAHELFACLMKTGPNKEQMVAITQDLEGLIEKHPQDPWLLYYLAAFENRSGGTGWEATSLRGIQLAEALGDAKCILWCRLNLLQYSLVAGRLEVARAQNDALEKSAPTDPLMRLQVNAIRARYLMEAQGDMDGAELLLAQMEDDLFKAGSFGIQVNWFVNMGNLVARRGDYRHADRLWRRYLAFAREHQHRHLEANALANLLACDIARLSPGEAQRDRVIEQARALLAFAPENNAWNMLPRYILARMPGENLGREMALEGLSRAVKSGDIHWQVHFQTLLAVTSLDNPIARDHLAKASRLVGEHHLHWLEAVNVVPLLDLYWRLYPRDQAVARSLQLLDTIEGEGKPGMAELNRVKMLSAWTDAYYKLSNDILAQRGPQALESAFSVMERMRARVLLEHLSSSQVIPQVPPALQLRLQQVRATITEHQKKLLSPQSEADRALVLDALKRYEMEENKVQGAIREASGFLREARPDFASLEQVRSHLKPDEAMISFQLGNRENMYGEKVGGAWVWVITAGEVQLLLLPDRRTLEPGLATFLGLAENEPDSPLVARAATQVYERLMGPALAALSSAPRRLIIIPDGPLHQLSFTALRPGEHEPPLALTHQLSIVPSATLWLRWRREALPLVRAALVFADPHLPGTTQDAPAETRGLADLSKGLARLPHAGREGQAVVGHLGGASTLLLGEDASEAALKRASLAEYGILHFAAHAVVDDQNPGRSAVVLSPGAENQDGLLQPREIAGLDLSGKLVVLSACRSASGHTLGGEGVMSLARAFMSAGAYGVVGTLWPLPDAQAAQFFDRFYAALAKGESTGTALQQAQIHLLDQDRPSNAWASVVLLGDGAFVPFPEGKPNPAEWLIPLVLLLLVAVLVWRFAGR